MRSTLLLLLLLPALAVADEADDWDRSDLFPDVAAWDAARAQVEADADAFADCKGRLGESSKVLAECLSRYFAISKDGGRVWVWASTGAATDNRDAEADARRGAAGQMWSRTSEATAWVEPELVALGSKQLNKLLKAPATKDYRVFVRDTLRSAEHTLSEREEGLLAAAGPVLSAPFKTFNMLTTADMTWPTVTLADGTEVTVDKSGYGKHRSSTNRDDRKAVFAAFYEAVGSVERTLGTTLNTHLQSDWFEAKARAYESSVEAALFADGIPVAVYETLVAQANANLPTLHRYLRLRARMLGVDDPGYVDIYPPMVSLEQEYPLALGKQLSIDSAAPLGADYVTKLTKGLNARWMDAYPKPGKSSGAFATGAYDVHPYVLMNYQDDYQSVSTLAHEWGHAMHTWLASEAQPYPSSDYDTFMAEVASTFNEVLLLEHMLTQSDDPQQQLYYLGSALEDLRGTFFRQAMFAEFELAAHQRVEAGEAMTGAALTALYLDILRRYHGHDSGVMTIDESFGVEWAWIPHFYFGFYVFQYATSVSASSLLARRVLDGEAGAVDQYLALLRAGGSDDSYVLLQNAGVDLATAAPYEALMAHMNAIIDRMEALLDEQP